MFRRFSVFLLVGLLFFRFLRLLIGGRVVLVFFEDLGFLKTVTKNPFGIYIYRIDIETVEQYVSEHMKEKLRQLTLLDLRVREEEAG